MFTSLIMHGINLALNIIFVVAFADTRQLVLDLSECMATPQIVCYIISDIMHYTTIYDTQMLV